MLKSASGVIRSHIEEIFGPDLTREEREELAALVYNADAEIKRQKKNPELDFDKWCKESIMSLVLICKAVSTKYTRSKVRRRLPKEYAYIIDELLHADDEENKSNYYGKIISTIVECGIAEEFIDGNDRMPSAHLAVDRLHIIGDICDRGSHPDLDHGLSDELSRCGFSVGKSRYRMDGRSYRQLGLHHQRAAG